jgi:branched-chain amino acid transport system substrate-binding protein
MIITITAAAVLGISISSCQKEETIKIGAIIALSGPASHLVDLRDAILLAADEVNSRGGINGREIELIYRRRSNQSPGRYRSINRIEKAHHPDLYISTLSSVSTILAPLAEENEVVLVALVVAVTELARQKEWVFRYWSSSARPSCKRPST